MIQPKLPQVPSEVLEIHPGDVPETIRALLRARRLSPLMRRIHSDLGSGDPAIQHQSVEALRRLGFPD